MQQLAPTLLWSEVKKTNKRLQDDFALTSSERKLKLIDQLHCEHYLKLPFHAANPATLKRPDTEATKSRNDQPIEGNAMSMISTISRMDEKTISVKNPNYLYASGNRLVVLAKVKYLSKIEYEKRVGDNIWLAACFDGNVKADAKTFIDYEELASRKDSWQRDN